MNVIDWLRNLRSNRKKKHGPHGVSKKRFDWLVGKGNKR